MVTLGQLINYFNDVDGRKYEDYVREIDNLNGHKTVDWIMGVVKKKGTIDDIMKIYDSYFATNPCNRWGEKTRENHRTAFTRPRKNDISVFMPVNSGQCHFCIRINCKEGSSRRSGQSGEQEERVCFMGLYDSRKNHQYEWEKGQEGNTLS